MKIPTMVALAFVCLTTLAWAQGAPPPRMPTAEGSSSEKATAPETTEVVPEAKVYGRQQQFVLPSGNIGCVYTPEGGTATYQPADGGPELFCDRVEPHYIRAILMKSGRAQVFDSVGDQSCCSAGPILDYDATWVAGPFSCVSTQTGLSCARDDGHSFFLSRRRVDAK